MNTVVHVHEYVSKSKRSCTVLAQGRREFHSTATLRFFTKRGKVWSALIAINESLLYSLI